MSSQASSKKRARVKLGSETTEARRSIALGKPPDLLQYHTGACVVNAQGKEISHRYINAARYEKADLLDLATSFARSYDTDHTNEKLSVNDVHIRIDADKRKLSKQRSEFIFDSSAAKRNVDLCEGNELKALRLEKPNENACASILQETHSWPVKWTGCSTSQHYASFKSPESVTQYLTEPAAVFPAEWKSRKGNAGQIKHAVCRAEEGEFTFEEDPYICQTVEEPFRPVALSVRRLVAAQLQQATSSNELPLSKNEPPPITIRDIAAKLMVQKGKNEECSCGTDQPSTKKRKAPWKPVNLKAEVNARCLHMQALETTIGRHAEGMIDATLHMIMNALQPYACTVASVAENQTKSALESVAFGNNESRSYYRQRNLKQIIQNHLPTTLNDFNPEDTDGVFNWEHVMMILQQQLDQSTERDANTTEVHPLLPSLPLNARVMQRIQDRVLLLCSKYQPTNTRRTTPTPVTEKHIEGLPLPEDDSWKYLRPRRPRANSNDSSEHEEDDDTPGQEIGVELPNLNDNNDS